MKMSEINTINKYLENILTEVDKFKCEGYFSNGKNKDLYNMFINEDNEMYINSTLEYIRRNYMTDEYKRFYNHYEFCKKSALSILNNENVIHYDNKLIDKKIYKEFNDNKINKTIILIIKITICLHFREKSTYLNNNNNIIELLNSLNNDNDNQYWFRGESDFSWHMTPSIIRDLDKNVLIDINYMEAIYKHFGLIDKYKNLILNNNSKFCLDFDFLAYMQHAASYSPLIDVTSNLYIACSFSLSNKKDFNKYKSINSSVYIISSSKEKILDYKEFNNFFQKQKSLVLYTKTLSLGSNITYSYYDSSLTEKKTKISLLKFNDLFSLLEPDFVYINKSTNDRMKYQRGGFIYFYNYLSINGRIFYELNPTLRYNKIAIDYKLKQKLYKTIKKDYEYYTIDNLLNPYDVFIK